MSGKRSVILLAALALLATACTPATPTASPSTAPSTTAPQATESAATSPPASTSPSAVATMLVVVYFGNTVLDPGTMECDRVYGVPRSVPASDDVLTAALTSLLAGPTAAETAQGYTSWFSAATADALIRARATTATRSRSRPDRPDGRRPAWTPTAEPGDPSCSVGSPATTPGYSGRASAG